MRRTSVARASMRGAQDRLLAALPLSESGLTVPQAAFQIARMAGALVLELRHTRRQVQDKAGVANIVTDADLESERAILAALQREYPDLRALSEESAGSLSGFSDGWIVDPIDGTNNYAYGAPFFCITLSLVRDGEVVFGLTYDPIHEEMFHAEKGAGAFLNGAPISISQRDTMKECFVGCDLGYDAEEGARMIAKMQSAWPKVRGFRLFGSSALGLAYVACGRFDIYLHPSLYPWDVAAGILMVNEAGGAVADWHGRPATFRSKQVFAHNRLVREEFVALVLNNVKAG